MDNIEKVSIASKLSNNYFYLFFFYASLKRWLFLCGDHKLEVFTPFSSLYGIKCLEKNIRGLVLPQNFNLPLQLFDG